MKKIILSAFILLFALSLNAQTDVSLKINHKLGTEDFMLDAVGTNNLGQEFKATRLEYYLTRVTIVHDGGMEIVVSDDVAALVRPQDEIATTIELGNFDVTTIEAVKFHIGVYEPVNTGDPALWTGDHPFAPKSPSMHWGWASGYRFIAYEGLGGSGFSQNFQLHGLGNENYFEVTTDVLVEDVGGTIVMNVNGDYAAGLKDIDLTSGTISHGSTGEAKQVLENWRDVVFGLYYAGITPDASTLSWSVYPNPSQGEIQITFADHNEAAAIHILNPLGEVVQVAQINNANQTTLNILNKGVYFVTVLNTQGETIATERIIIK